MVKITRIIVGIITMLCLVSGIWAGEKIKKQDYHDIYSLFQNREFEKALVLVEQKIKSGDHSMRLIQMKYDLLFHFNRFSEALELIEDQIKIHGETDVLLQAQSNAMMRLGKIGDAIRVSIKKYDRSKKQSPWDCMNIMHLYLQINDINEALNWLQKAVSQGFINYRLLASPKYKILEDQSRFYEIIDTIKFSVGLGNKARLFKTPLLSGGEFSLEANKGKVILIQFWATWCSPCVNEVGFLKQIHQECKNDGFEIVGINLDSDPNRARAFITEKKMDWVHACTGKVWEDDTVKTYGVNNLPTYFLIDRNGILRAMDLKGVELENAVKELLKSK